MNNKQINLFNLAVEKGVSITNITDYQNKDSIFSLVNKVKNAPFIYLACGEEDFIFSHSEKLNAALEEKDLDYKYEHWSGIHDWAFWDEAVKKAFKLFF